MLDKNPGARPSAVQIYNALLPFITVYFLLRRGAERRDSLAYLSRILGRRASWWDAARHIHCFASTILDRVFLLFPDPWPKRRHAQRRFVNRGNLDRLSELIVQGGELRIASDDPVYIEWVLQHVPVHPAFEWLAQGPADWLDRPTDAIETRYEKKAREAGRVPHFFRFRRR